MKTTKNRFIKEVADAAQNNPHIDMKQIKEWLEMEKTLNKMLECVPPEPEAEVVKPRRLQPIPLRMFGV